MARNDFEFHLGRELGELKQRTQEHEERLENHHERIEKVETWKEQEQSIRNQKKAVVASLKIAVAIGILTVVFMFCIGLLTFNRSDLNEILPQLIELIKLLM